MSTGTVLKILQIKQFVKVGWSKVATNESFVRYGVSTGEVFGLKEVSPTGKQLSFVSKKILQL